MAHRIKVTDIKPYFYYSREPTGTLKKEAYLRSYYLIAPDSWERGSAGSLHLDYQSSKNFKQRHWWVDHWLIRGTETVYVSKSTLERVMETKDKMLWWEWSS